MIDDKEWVNLLLITIWVGAVVVSGFVVLIGSFGSLTPLKVFTISGANSAILLIAFLHSGTGTLRIILTGFVTITLGSLMLDGVLFAVAGLYMALCVAIIMRMNRSEEQMCINEVE